MNIFITNLSYQAVDSELKALFENFGTVDSAKIITDKNTGRSRGFGFVEMPDDKQARKAIKELHDTDYKGRALDVKEATKKEDR